MFLYGPNSNALETSKYPENTLKNDQSLPQENITDQLSHLHLEALNHVYLI
jgi:hypothetical protein